MDTPPEITNLDACPAIAIRAQVPLAELPAFFGSVLPELGACGKDQIAGPPFARYYSFDPAHVDVEAIIPLRAAVPVSGRVQAITLDGGPAVQIRHVGSYQELGETYASIEHWMEDHHRQRAEAVREVYLTGPTVPATDQVTIVVQPLQPAG